MWTLPLLRSGIAPIDERLGGLTPGRPHLLTGAPGAGKTALCLGIVATALEDGKSAAILTQDEPTDLVAQAFDLGIDLPRFATIGRLAVVRYAAEFAMRVARLVSTDAVVDELVRSLGPESPELLVVDSILPFVDGGTAGGSGVYALLQALDRVRRTTLLTWPGDVRERYDQRLDPLLRPCAAVLHVSSCGGGVGRIDLVKSRARLTSDAPIYLRFVAGRGLVALDDDGQTRGKRRVLIVPGTDPIDDDLVAALTKRHPVATHGGPLSKLTRALGRDVGALLVGARWDGIDDAAMLLWQLRGAGHRTPALLVAHDALRSSDRTRALRAGFDDVVGPTMSAAELVARVSAAMERGPSARVPVSLPVTSSEPADASPAAVLDEAQFRAAVEAAAGKADGSPFAVLFMSPEKGQLTTLASLVARTVRAAQGDMVGVVRKRVAVYLPGARRAEASAVVRRVREEWLRSARDTIRVAQRVHPADDAALRADLRLVAMVATPPTTAEMTNGSSASVVSTPVPAP